MCKAVFIDGVAIKPCQFVIPPSTSNVIAQVPFELHLDTAQFKEALVSIYEKHKEQVRHDDALDPSDHDELTEAGYPDFDDLSAREDLMLLVFNEHLYSEFADTFNVNEHFVLYRYYLSGITGYRKVENTHIFSGSCQDMGDRIIDTSDEYNRQVILEQALDKIISEETKSVLRSIVTRDKHTIILVGLLLDETTDINIARLMLVVKDPGADPNTTHSVRARVYQRLKDVDVDAAWERLCEKWGPSELNNWTTPEIPPVEDAILSALGSFTDDDGNFYTY